METMGRVPGEQGGRVPHHLPPDTVLNGKYMVKRVIGEGGFGITYEGEETNLNLKVAIKEYYPSGFVTRGNSQVIAHTGGGEELYERGKEKFLEEARVLAKFQFLPGIVGVRDFFLENNTAYIVMEYLDGMTLREYTERAGGRLPAGQILALMRPVLNSLSQVHREGLVHRDISPDNIMVTKAGMVKLLDFGAAREISPSGDKSLSVLLKPGYAPMEQYQVHGVQGPWTDVYALCATIYRCMTGEAPTEPLERLRWDQMKPPSALGADTGAWQDSALMKGLSIYPEDRYQTVEELGKALYWSPDPSPYADAPVKTVRQNPPCREIPGPGEAGKPDSGHGKARRVSGGRKKLVIGLLLLVCALGGAAVWLLLPKGRAALVGNSNGNISNYGAVAASSSGFVYGSVNRNGIQVMERGGTWKTTETTHNGSVNLWEEWIYYIGEEGGVERIPVANPERTPESVGGSDVSFFLISDETIYYTQDNGPIRCMSLSGKRDRLLADGSNYGINFENGWLYFLRTDSSDDWPGVWKMKTDGTGLTRVGTHQAESYLVEDGWVYYTDPEDNFGLRRMKTDGKQDVSLHTGFVGMFNVCGDWLYYTGSGSHSGLYQVKRDGSGERLVDSRDPGYLYDVEGTLYYAFLDESSGVHRLYSLEEDGVPVLVYKGEGKAADEETPADEGDPAGDEPFDPVEPEDAETGSLAGNEIFTYQGEPVASMDLILEQIQKENMEEVTVSQFEQGNYQSLEPLDYVVHAYEFADSVNEDGSRNLTVYTSIHGYEDTLLSDEDFIVIAIKEDHDMKFCVAKSDREGRFPMEISEGGTASPTFTYQVPDGYQCAFVFTNLQGGTVNGPMRMTVLN